MQDDPIVAEVRKVREEHASRFNFDLDAIYRDLKEKEALSGRGYLRFHQGSGIKLITNRKS